LDELGDNEEFGIGCGVDRETVLDTDRCNVDSDTVVCTEDCGPFTVTGDGNCGMIVDSDTVLCTVDCGPGTVTGDVNCGTIQGIICDKN
jgi:hypothetical protein